MHCLSVGSQRVLVFLASLLLCGVPMRAQDAATVCTVISGANEGAGTLRDLVFRANCDIIDFHPFIDEIQIQSQVDILRKVTIAGPGADLLTIRGTGGGSRLFDVAPHSVAISGITLTGGNPPRGGDGGAIRNSGALTLERVIITGNSGGLGGGIENSGILTLDGVTISGNSAGRAGGIFNNGGTVIVNNSTISGNSAGEGSAIAGFGNLILRNSTVSGNSGFIAISYRGDMTVTNSTVAGNLRSGNALQVLGLGSLTIKNSIVAANERFLSSNCRADTLVNLGGNLSDDDSCGFTQVALEDLALGPLADHGGPTQTLALGPDSVAIDSADCTDAGGSPVIADQRGSARPQGPACDAGAFERRVLAITTESLPNAMVGQPYSVTLQFSGETSLVTWSLAAGELPAGLALDASTGEISGTPTADGDFLFTARAQAAAGAGEETAIRSLTIAVLGNLKLLTEQLDGGAVGEPYAETLEATGQAEPYIWGVISGALPPGLSLDPLSGNLSGVPTEAGDFHFRMNVTTVVAGFISTVSHNLTVTITGGTISDVIAAAYGAIANGSLVGDGPGNSAPGRLQAWLDMLHAAKEMLDAGDVSGSCGQLAQAYLRADGEPPDFVTGPAAPALAHMIAELRLSLGCS